MNFNTNLFKVRALNFLQLCNMQWTIKNIVGNGDKPVLPTALYYEHEQVMNINSEMTT